MKGKARIFKGRDGRWWAWYVPKAKGQHEYPLSSRDTKAELLEALREIHQIEDVTEC